MRKLTIVKIGGQVIDNDEHLNKALEAFSELNGAKILVHGGGKSANRVLLEMGIEPKMIDGRRVTDKETLDVAVMVYGGLINKKIVARLQTFNCNALGMSGADADAILAVKREVGKIDYGFVGDVVRVNNEIIDKLLKVGLKPVFCALTHDGQGQILNTNADTIVASLGSALSERYSVDLVYCFEKNGVLRDQQIESSVIDFIDPKLYIEYKEKGVISEGMIPKIDTAFNSLKHGVENVYITNFQALMDRKYENGYGTRIIL